MSTKTNLRILVLLFCSLFLLACGKKETNTELLDTIKEKQTLVVALSPEFAPFEFKTLVDGKDTIVGSDIQLAQAIADELGVELELSPMSFDNVLASLQSGKADLAISGISATEERAKIYDFSDSYYTAKNVLIVADDATSTYTKASELAGKSIAVQKGSVQENLAKSQFTDSNIVSLTSTSNMVTELLAGKVDALILEEPIAKGYIANNPGLGLAEMTIDSTDTDSYAIAMAKGNDKLKATVNKVVKDLVDSGQYDQYVQEAFELSIQSNE